MKFLSLFTFIIFFSFYSFSQVKLEERIEFEINDGYGGERIIPFGKYGVLVMTKRDKAEQQQDLWRFQLYDTSLNLIEEETFELHVSYYADETYSSDDHLYALFRKKQGSYTILSINIETLEMTTIEGSFEKGDYVYDLAVVGEKAYMKVTGKRNKMIYVLDLKSGKHHDLLVEVDGFRTKDIYVRNFQVLEESNELFIYIEAGRRNESELYIHGYDQSGTQTIQTQIDINLDKSLTDITLSKVSDHKYAFTGTFSKKGGNVSQGIYFGLMAEGKRIMIKFYSFLDLENFLNYLPERKAAKIKKKQQRKKSRGKELTLSYYMESHPIIYKDNKYIFLGEAYYSTYRTESYTTTVNGQTVTRSRQVFDGYQYTHAMLAAFDEKGELLWDNIFEMWPSYKPYRAIRFISVAEDNSVTLDMVFSSYNAIRTMSFNYSGEVEKERSSEYISTDDKADDIRTSFTQLNYWYGNYFINYGQAKIKNRNEGLLKKKRKVYFISKVGY